MWKGYHDRLPFVNKRLGVSFLSKMLYNKHGFGPRDRVSKYYTADKCFNPFYVDSVIYYLYFIAVYGLLSFLHCLSLRRNVLALFILIWGWKGSRDRERRAMTKQQLVLRSSILVRHYRHSRPQSPSFLGHVVEKRGRGLTTGRLQIKPSGSGDENALPWESVS